VKEYRVRLAGVGFAVLVLVSEVLKGDSPSPNTPAVSAVVAAAFLVGGASLARDGFFAPDGGYGFILFWLLPLWGRRHLVVTARPMTSGG